MQFRRPLTTVYQRRPVLAYLTTQSPWLIDLMNILHLLEAQLLRKLMTLSVNITFMLVPLCQLWCQCLMRSQTYFNSTL